MIDLARQNFLVPQMRLGELERISRFLTRQLLRAEATRKFAKAKQILLRKLSIVEIEIRRTGGQAMSKPARQKPKCDEGRHCVHISGDYVACCKCGWKSVVPFDVLYRGIPFVESHRMEGEKK